VQQLVRIARMGLWLGATVFGGVSAAYPIIRERAGELGDISGEDIDGLYALSVFLPAPSFLNLWGAVAMRAAGLAGAVVGSLSLMVPAFVLVLTLPLLGQIPLVGERAAGAFEGAVWATVGLLVAAGMELLRRLTGPVQWLAGACLLALLFAGVHPVLLLVSAIAVGAASAYRSPRKGGL
jgi:chromate transport protein ChrA